MRLPSHPTFGCLKEQRVTYAAVFVRLGCCDKFHRLSGFNNKQLFLTVLEARKFKIKVPVNVVSGEVPLSGLQRAIFLLCPRVGGEGTERENERGWGVKREGKSLVSFFSCEDTNLIKEVYPEHNYLPKTPPTHTANIIPLGIRVSTSIHFRGGGYKHVGYNRCCRRTST